MNTQASHKFTFHTGEYVVHGITGAFKGRCSAWFKADGTIQDAEQILHDAANGRPVRPNGPIWRVCQAFGTRYKAQ